MKRVLSWFLALVAASALLAAPATPPPPPAPPADDEETGISADDLYEAGKNLFDSLAPPEIKEQFEFPDKARWDDTIRRLQAALEGSDPQALLQFEPEVRAALTALQNIAGAEDYTDWLAERLDYIEAAKELPATTTSPSPAQDSPSPAKEPTSTPPVTPPEPSTSPARAIPQYELWLKRTRQRPVPANAGKLVPVLKPVFSDGGIPAELVWLAEVESSFNPKARSPVGARGLFQLMPATAKELGLSTFLPDERTDPEKSAQASAEYLKKLHAKFGDWPLAIAAYNAGSGRVSRALAKGKAQSFAEIAPALSVETQMYVPKVLATVEVRDGRKLAK